MRPTSPGGVGNSANLQDEIQIAICHLFPSVCLFVISLSLFLRIFQLVINSCSIFNELNVFALTGSGGSGTERGL